VYYISVTLEKPTRICVNLKSFPSHKAYKATSISLALSLHCKTTDKGLVHHAACLFVPQLRLVLIAPTHGGMARLSWPGWLTAYQDGYAICQWSPIQVLTLIKTNVLITTVHKATTVTCVWRCIAFQTSMSMSVKYLYSASSQRSNLISFAFFVHWGMYFRVSVSRQNHFSASIFACSYPFLRSTVRHLSSVCRLSHWCTLLKSFEGFTCHLAGTLARFNNTLC